MDEEASGADALAQAHANLIGAEAAALAEDDDVQALARVAGKAPAGGDDDDDDDGGDGTAAAPPPPASTPAPTTAPSAAPAADTGADDAAGTPAPAVAVVPPHRAAIYMPVPDITDLETKETDLATRREAIRQQYRDGDIDLDKRDAELEKLSDERRELDRVRDRHATAIDYNRNLDMSIYVGRIDAVKSQARSEGIDYDTNPALMHAWDSHVKAMSRDPEMVKKGDAHILAEAHKKVVAEIRAVAERLGLKPAGAPSPTPAPGASDAVRQAVAQRTPTKTGVKSLATVPQAAETHVGGNDEFADLEGLDAMEQERRMAAWSPEKTDRYLAGK